MSLETEHGQFSLLDTDGDGLYENNLLCKWTIIEEERDTIYIQLLYIDVEDDENCDYDYLHVIFVTIL